MNTVDLENLTPRSPAKQLTDDNGVPVAAVRRNSHASHVTREGGSGTPVALSRTDTTSAVAVDNNTLPFSTANNTAASLYPRVTGAKVIDTQIQVPGQQTLDGVEMVTNIWQTEKFDNKFVSPTTIISLYNVYI